MSLEQTPREMAERLLGTKTRDRFTGFLDSVANDIGSQHSVLVSPWATLNSQMGFGGFRNDLTYILAASSVGKTYLLCNLINGLAKNKNDDDQPPKQLFFSFEMVFDDVILRLMQGACSRHYSDIYSTLQDPAKEKDSEVLLDNFSRTGLLDSLAIIDKPIRLEVMDACMELYKPRVVYLDHIDLVPHAPGMTDLEEQAATALWLMEAKKKHKCAIFTLWQINKPSGGQAEVWGSTMPDKRHGRGSSKIIDSADFILGACRPDMDAQCPKLDKGVVMVQWLKRRFASEVPDIPVPLKYDRETSILREQPMAEPHPKPKMQDLPSLADPKNFDHSTSWMNFPKAEHLTPTQDAANWYDD